MASRWWWWPAGAGALALAIAIPFWPGFTSPNEWPRLYQAAALVHRGSLAINWEVAQWGSCEDLSAANGWLFPNKAPGLLPLLVPAAGLAHLLGHGPGELRVAYLLGRLFAALLPWGWATLFLSWQLWRRWGQAGTLVSGAMAVASSWLPAGGLVFSHAWAGACATAGLFFSQKQTPWALWWTGFFWGWMAVSEYPTALPMAVGLMVLLVKVRGRSWPAFLGAGLWLGLLGLYNWECFGSPWVLSSARETFAGFAALSQQGFWGISWPRPENLWLLLFSPQRGLLFFAPLLLFGLWPGSRGTLERTACAQAWALFLPILGYANAHGGWFPGPRYVLAAFPLLAVGAAARMAKHWHRLWVRAFAGAAAFFTLPAAWLPVCTFPFSPAEFPLPALTFHWVLLGGKVFMPSWLPGLGGLLATGLLAILCLLWFFALPGKPLRVPLLSLLLALALWLVCVQLAPLPTFRQRLQLAVVHDLYTRTPGARWLPELIPLAKEKEQGQLWWWLRQLPEAAGAPP